MDPAAAPDQDGCGGTSTSKRNPFPYAVRAADPGSDLLWSAPPHKEEAMKKTASGFTLVELIVVIVILGILAVTASPKLMSLSGDAKIATLRGISGALESSLKLAYSKAVIHGLEKAGCAMICVSGSCSRGQAYACSDAGASNLPDGYILLKNGSLNSNSAQQSLMNILDTDASLKIQSCGPAGNMCILFQEDTTSCCSFVGASFRRDADACMVHTWLYGGENVQIQTIEGGC